MLRFHVAQSNQSFTRTDLLYFYYQPKKYNQNISKRKFEYLIICQITTYSYISLKLELKYNIYILSNIISYYLHGSMRNKKKKTPYNQYFEIYHTIFI